MALTSSSSRVAWTIGFLRSLVDTFRTAHVPFLAGSIAYSAFVSLLPLLLLAMLVATVVGGRAVADYVVELTAAYLSPSGQTVVTDALQQATAQTGLSLLSLAVLLWAAFRLLRGLDLAFSMLYGTDESTGILDQVIDGLVVIVAIPIAVAGMVAIMVAVSLLPALPYGRIVDKVLVVALLTVTLLPVFYVFPDVPVSAREVLPGTIVAALGWTVLAATFQVYVSVGSTAEIYGVLGGVVLLVTLLYFGALVLLLGATVNVVLRDGTRPNSPVKHPG